MDHPSTTRFNGLNARQGIEQGIEWRSTDRRRSSLWMGVQPVELSLVTQDVVWAPHRSGR